MEAETGGTRPQAQGCQVCWCHKQAEEVEAEFP